MRNWLVCLFLLIACATAARADELRPGYLELVQTGSSQWQTAWKLPVTSTPGSTVPVPDIPAICRFVAEPETRIEQAAISGSAKMECSGDLGGQKIGMPGLLGQSDMLVRIQPLTGSAQALRLTAREPSVQLARAPSTGQVLQTYFVLGVEHILAGWDHLLFVIALVLLIGQWRHVLIAATAFTLAHSITLAGAALGFVGLPQRPVEALIALSIVFLALEILRDGTEASLTRRYPWVVAFAFGLLHGFGFAGALREIGLPQGDVVAALLAFNVGVEAGQILVVALVLALIAAMKRFAAPTLAPALRATAYGIGIISAYWLLDRTIFGSFA